jgi:integrase
MRYDGARGSTWSIKYVDGSGTQVRERLGKSTDGWTRRKAQAALRRRLTDVERDGYRKPVATTFEVFAQEWLSTVPEAREHRRTTRADYRGVVENHLIPHFRECKLADVTTADIDAYVAAKRRARPPLGPRTLNLHVTRLGQIFGTARRRGLVTTNPVADAERPRVPKSRWTILSPVEIAAVMRAYDELIVEAQTEMERMWLQTAKAMTVTMQFAWLRRGELLGLKWGAVELGNPDGARLHVRETWVRGARSDPKTDDGTRTIALVDELTEELWQHWRRSKFQADGELVFCHPLKGSPIASGYFGALVKTVLARSGVGRPMREFHDWRHTGITNAAAAGMNPVAIKQMAGHADFKTTQTYIDLAGVVFGSEASKQSAWYSTSGTKARYEVAADDAQIESQSRVAATDG